ncbi:hypothetical protein ACJX0J_017459, partial [Zea mays]
MDLMSVLPVRSVEYARFTSIVFSLLSRKKALEKTIPTVPRGCLQFGTGFSESRPINITMIKRYIVLLPILGVHYNEGNFGVIELIIMDSQIIKLLLWLSHLACLMASASAA